MLRLPRRWIRCFFTPSARRIKRAMSASFPASPKKTQVRRMSCGARRRSCLGSKRISGERTVCMPGTHCKWVRLNGDAVTGFTTFLTGELYNIFSAHSLLRHSVDPAARVLPDDADFLHACRGMMAAPDQLPARLFSIRAASLLQGLTPPRASAVLSGLLIGAEVGAAKKSYASDQLVLVGSGGLGLLYRAALEMAGFSVVPADAEALVRAGLFAAARAFWPAGTR